MRFVLKVRPHEGMTYDRLLQLALAAEAAGFEGFFRSDHWVSTKGNTDAGSSETWTSIAGIARETHRIRLGTLVTPVTFHHPYALAKIVASLDEMSAGRIELGLGVGGNEPEHRSLAFDFSPLKDRFDRLEEHLSIIVGLWTTKIFSNEGRLYSMKDARLEPKPIQRPHPPIIMGGSGRPRALGLAARFAAELNLDEPSLEDVRSIWPRLHEACAEIGRAPETLVVSALIDWPQGSPKDQALHIGSFEAAGVQRLYLDIGNGSGPIDELRRFGARFITAG